MARKHEPAGGGRHGRRSPAADAAAVAEARKGTAAADPVLVATNRGPVAGAVVGGSFVRSGPLAPTLAAGMGLHAGVNGSSGMAARNGTSGGNAMSSGTMRRSQTPAGLADGMYADLENGPAEGAPRDTRSPHEIEAGLERTRAHLGVTLDELGEQLTPVNLARRGGRSVKARMTDPETGQPRRGVAIGAGVAAATAMALAGLEVARRVRSGRDC